MFRRTTKHRGFSLVEILIVVFIIALLMAVAIPRLLGSRDSSADSVAQQQLNIVSTDVTTYVLRTNALPSTTVLVAGTPTVKIFTDGTASSKGAGGSANALSVSASVTASVVYLAAQGRDGVCWGLKLTTTGKQYGFHRIASCTGSTIQSATNWNDYGFPSAD